MSSNKFIAALAVGAFTAGAFTVGSFVTAGPVKAQGIEEIVVTARKREESLQTVPVAVTAFSSEELTGQISRDLADLSNLIPNFTGTGNIRGLQDNIGLVTGDAAVGLYLDGAYLARSENRSVPIVAIERTEVLRGPQGTLFGRNTTGGAINIITKKPHGEFAGSAEFLVGNFGRNDYTVDLNLPLMGDELAARLTYESRNRSGVENNLTTGQEVGQDDRNAFFGSVLWNPSDDLEVIVRGDWRTINNGNTRHNLTGFTGVTEIVGGPNPGSANLSKAILDLSDGTSDAIFGPGAVCPGTGGFCFLGLGSSPGLILIDYLGGSPTPDDFIVDFYKDGKFGELHGNENEFLKREEWGVNFTATYDIDGNMGTKFIASYRDMNSENNQDIDGLPVTILQADLVEAQTQFQAEWQIYGTNEIFGFNTEWIGGAYYFKEHGDDDSFSNALVGFNPFNPRFITGEANNNSVAGFGSLDIDLMEDVTLNMGGRYTRDMKQLISRNSIGAFPSAAAAGGLASAVSVFTDAGEVGSFAFQTDKTQFRDDLGFEATGGNKEGIWTICAVNNSSDVLDTPGVCEATFRDKFDAFTWNFGLDWQAIDTADSSLLGYFNYSRGYRSGGQNLRDVFGDNAFLPEYVRSYEVGIKSDWFGGNLRVNLAAFDLDYQNIQVTTIVNTAGGLSQLTGNAATATIRGFEGEVTAVPLPDTISGLTLRGTVGYQDAAYDDFPDRQPAIDGLPFHPVNNPLVLIDRTDEPFTSTPEWNYSLSGIYNHSLDIGDLTLRADWSWNDVIHRSNTSRDVNLTSGKAYGLLNARAALQLLDPNLELALWCKNCTDKLYKSGAISFVNNLGPILSTRGELRTFGGEITWRFGAQ